MTIKPPLSLSLSLLQGKHVFWYVTKYLCWEIEKERERERKKSLSLTPLSLSRKNSSFIKNGETCLIRGRKSIRVTQKHLFRFVKTFCLKNSVSKKPCNSGEWVEIHFLRISQSSFINYFVWKFKNLSKLNWEIFGTNLIHCSRLINLYCILILYFLALETNSLKPFLKRGWNLQIQRKAWKTCSILIPRKLNNSGMAAELSHLLSVDQMKHWENCRDIFCNLVAAKVAREVRGKGNA